MTRTVLAALALAGLALGLVLVVNGNGAGWTLIVGCVGGAVIAFTSRRLGGSHPRVAVAVACALGLTLGFMGVSVATHLGSMSSTTQISGVPATPAAFTSHSSRGHFTDHMCLVERNHGKYDGSCQDFYSSRVTDLHRACHSCGGLGELPCSHWHPGMTCTALLHFDFHSWGPPLYSLHETVRAYFDGYHTWASRTYKGWRGYQRCWVGYAVGADVEITDCDSLAQYRHNGSYRLQGADWFFDVKISLGLPWIPVQSSFRDNMLHWPYPGPSQTWIS